MTRWKDFLKWVLKILLYEGGQDLDYDGDKIYLVYNENFIDRKVFEEKSKNAVKLKF